MGDIADMMIDGLLDCDTGEYIDGDAPGFPRTRKSVCGPCVCPYCGKLLKSEQGVQDHILAKHHAQMLLEEVVRLRAIVNKLPKATGEIICFVGPREVADCIRASADEHSNFGIE